MENEIRCSDCGRVEGEQHRPSCHRQGAVTSMSDYRDPIAREIGQRAYANSRPLEMLPPPHTGKCRLCGCTETTPCAEGCYWAAPNLCSECAEFTFLAAEYLIRTRAPKESFAQVYDDAIELMKQPEFSEVNDAVPVIIQPDTRIVLP